MQTLLKSLCCLIAQRTLCNLRLLHYIHQVLFFHESNFALTVTLPYCSKSGRTALSFLSSFRTFSSVFLGQNHPFTGDPLFYLRMDISAVILCYCDLTRSPLCCKYYLLLLLSEYASCSILFLFDVCSHGGN